MHHLGTYIFLSFSPKLMDEDMSTMIDNHTVKQISPKAHLGATVLIDLPISVNDKAKISWRVQIESIGNGKHFPNYIYFVGITSNRCKDFSKSAHSGLTAHRIE